MHPNVINNLSEAVKKLTIVVKRRQKYTFFSDATIVYDVTMARRAI